MLKSFLVINTVLVFLGYHPALVYAFYSSGSQATSNQYYIDNLYLLVPVTLFFASLPNLLIVAYFRYKKKLQHIGREFLFAEAYVTLIQVILHVALLLFATYW